MPTDIPVVTLLPVDWSSNITGVGYDEATRTLAVEYVSGALYHYHDVDPEVWRGCAAVVELRGSVGKFIWVAMVKGVRYRYTRIE